MHVAVAILTGGNVVLGTDEGSGGVGSVIYIADEALGDDGLLSPGETFTQEYEIGLSAAQPFSFFVNEFGRDP